jgi:hypothetical protein
MTRRNIIPPEFSNVPPPVGNMAFANEDPNREVIATRGVKIKSKDSIRREEEAKQKADIENRFHNKADSYLTDTSNKNRIAMEKSRAFIKISSDKTLPANKSIIATDVETSIRQDFIQLGIDMNKENIGTDDDGVGSIALITVLSKIALDQRDRLNLLEYELEQLKKKMSRPVQASVPESNG